MTCSQCKFFQMTRKGFDLQRPEPDFTEGYCKRFPPMPYLELNPRENFAQTTYHQPIILGINWCGEFQELEPVPIKDRTPGVV